jgi:hypothetical protein
MASSKRRLARSALRALVSRASARASPHHLGTHTVLASMPHHPEAGGKSERQHGPMDE